jgi:hypothetical protein
MKIQKGFGMVGCLGVVVVGEKGVHESRRRVKCQDHAWKMLRKRKGTSGLQRVV